MINLLMPGISSIANEHGYTASADGPWVKLSNAEHSIAISRDRFLDMAKKDKHTEIRGIIENLLRIYT